MNASRCMPSSHLLHSDNFTSVDSTILQVGEAGELAECFQWKGEVPCGLPGFTDAERQHVGACCCYFLL